MSLSDGAELSVDNDGTLHELGHSRQQLVDCVGLVVVGDGLVLQRRHAGVELRLPVFDGCVCPLFPVLMDGVAADGEDYLAVDVLNHKRIVVYDEWHGKVTRGLLSAVDDAVDANDGIGDECARWRERVDVHGIEGRAQRCFCCQTFCHLLFGSEDSRDAAPELAQRQLQVLHEPLLRC